MPRKGNVTREMIVERAAGLFNTAGYYRASISDLMAATGLEKGGIYNHFESKDELAVAAFEHAVRLFGERLVQASESQANPRDKLIAFIEAFQFNVHNPPLAGGCPLLNCAVENDEGNPILKEKVQVAGEKLLSLTERLVKEALLSEENSTRAANDARRIATFIISSLEGGIMLSRLHSNPCRIDLVVDCLKEYLCELTAL